MLSESGRFRFTRLTIGFALPPATVHEKLDAHAEIRPRGAGCRTLRRAPVFGRRRIAQGDLYYEAPTSSLPARRAWPE